jgi:hypothetical protein
MINSELTVFRSESGKFGFINKKGEVVIKPVYDQAENFSEGLAAVNIGLEMGHYFYSFIAVKEGQWGFINEKGEVVIPIIYHSVTAFSEGLAVVNNNYYIDKTGKVAITLAKKYDKIYSFVGGIAMVMRNNHYGYIDREGNEIVPPVHTKNVIERGSVDQFIYEKTLKLSPFESSGKWGYKNYKEEIVIPALYNVACAFSDDLALVEKDGQWFYIHKDGSQATPFLPYDHTENFSNGYARVRSGKCWGYIDKTGKEVVPVKYDFGVLSATPVEKLIQLTLIPKATEGKDKPETLTPFQSAGKWGYMNEQSEIIIPAKYENASKFSEGLAKVKLNTRWGFIDSDGREVILCLYDEVRDFYEGVVAVKRDKTYVFGHDTWGFVDKSGKEIIQPKYWQVGDFSGGVALVCHRKYGYVDKTGKEVVPLIYELYAIQSIPLKELLSKHSINKDDRPPSGPDTQA